MCLDELVRSMSIKFSDDISFCSEDERGKKFLEQIWGKRPSFVCVIGNTETAKIPGLSAAGANPAATDFTPPADVELLFYGKCKCIDGVPVTPNGIPTPGLITMSAIKLSNMPFFVVNGGLRVKPHIPYFEVEGSPGDDIRTGASVKNPEVVYDNAFIAGKSLARLSDYLVVGESLPGGTTTALGVLTALGYDAGGKVSSTLPDNPHDLKNKVVAEGLNACGMSREALKKDPMACIQAVGGLDDASCSWLLLLELLKASLYYWLEEPRWQQLWRS